ncbi:hypothetical protein GIB67_001688 [Kingdonia uniflora]|uniref:Uncharacterized protein n=1 Tax=Kingdonia uniflora TaxID=39325 RepID=A0A7J7LN29_9MAGN|nr:hypothetical protein GIB67_001688 [Kingdonia uniflora]
MDIGNDIDIVYYNGTGSEVVEEGFLCYLNQIAYGLSVPLAFFQKEVMNALKSCPGQLNGNIFEMMRVCEVLNQKWRDGGIARQFVADDILKYYKFKYVKDRKNGYLFSDSARPKFFDFESFGMPCREGSKLNKVLGELGIRREKRLNSVVEKVQQSHQKRAMAASGSAYVDVMEIPACDMGTSRSLVRRLKMKKTVLHTEQTTPAQIPPVGTEGVVVDVNMAPPLKKQKKESGKDIRASSKGVNLEAVEQEALDLATRDPIHLDTQIRSSISQFSVAWKSVVEVLKLAAANRGKLVRQHDVEKDALQEQFEQEKVLQREQFEKEKVLQKEQFEKEAAAIKQEVEDEDVNLALARKYDEIVFPGHDTSPVAEQTLAPPVADDLTNEEVVHLRGKVIEMEKALSRARDCINRTQQGQRALRILFFNIKKEDRKIYAQLEIDLRHACDELERCMGHNAYTQQRLQVYQSRLKKKITPKRGKRASDTDHERQMADVITFYVGELERVENEFRHYISSCGKDVEVENDKVENMWFTKGDEGGGVSTSKPRAEESKEEEIEDLLPHTRHKTRLQEVVIFNEPLHVDASSSRWVIVNNTDLLKKQDFEIRYMREYLKKLSWDLREARDSCQRKKDRAKTFEEACSNRDRELNRAINKYNSWIADLDRDKQALVQECIQGNVVFEELHPKYKELQRMMDTAEAEINYSREVDSKLYRLKLKIERSVQITKQYKGSLLQEKKSLEARCKNLDNELNKVKTEFYEATLLSAENVTLRAMAMLHADVEKFRTERDSILASTTKYVTKYDLQIARLSYIDNLMPRVLEL